MSDGPRLLPGPAHFIVEEEPAYLPEGSGEHLYVHIEKEGLTTESVAESLAKACGKHHRDYSSHRQFRSHVSSQNERAVNTKACASC